MDDKKQGISTINTSLEKEKISYKTNKNGSYEIGDKIFIYPSKKLLKNLLYKNEKDKISPNTLRLFIYIIFNLKVNEKSITLGEDKLKKEINLGSSSYYTAISQLEKLEIIRKLDDKKRNTEFEINANFMFRGNRLNYFMKHLNHLIQPIKQI